MWDGDCTGLSGSAGEKDRKRRQNSRRLSRKLRRLEEEKAAARKRQETLQLLQRHGGKQEALEVLHSAGKLGQVTAA